MTPIDTPARRLSPAPGREAHQAHEADAPLPVALMAECECPDLCDVDHEYA